MQGLWATQCRLRPKLNAYEGDGDVTSDRGNTETAGNPERVPASKLGRYPTESAQVGRELGLPQEDVGLESGGGLDGKHPCAFVSGSDIEKRKNCAQQ